MMGKDHLMDIEFHKQVVPILTQIARLQVLFALCALLWAIWSRKGRPRWISTLTLALALCVLFICMLQT